MKLKHLFEQYGLGLVIFITFFAVMCVSTWHVSRHLLAVDCSQKYVITSSVIPSSITSCAKGFSIKENVLPAALALVFLIFCFTYLSYKFVRSIWIGKFSWLILAMLSLATIGFLVVPFMLWQLPWPLRVLSILLTTAYFGVLLALRITNQRQRKEALEETFEFASGTVGSFSDQPAQADMLGFKTSASNVRAALLSVAGPVTVVSITGRLGSGKSSFWRIIAEGFDKERTLHTYISLTQANSIHDFSKLFAERWSDTLTQRYPILFNASYFEQRRLFEVLRDASDGLLKIIFSIVPLLSVGLFKTRTKESVWDDAAEVKNRKFVDRALARMFYHLPSVKEDRWFIVIDEIERAPFEEIYRVIEVLERFKQVARKGLPIRIIFILCIDDHQALETLRLHKELTEKTALIRSFIGPRSKLINRTFRVPTADTNTKLDFIDSHLKLMLGDDVLGEKTAPLLKDIYDFENGRFKLANRPAQVSDGGLADRQERFLYIMGLLAVETPRVIVHIINGIKSRRAQLWMSNYSLTEHLIYEYLAVTQPQAIELVSELVMQDNDLHIDFEAIWREHEDLERDVRQRAFAKYGVTLDRYTDEDLERIAGVLKVCIPRIYIALWSADADRNKYAVYAGTLSDDAVLKSLLNFRDERDEKTAYFAAYYTFKEKGIWSSELNDAKRLVDFSSFVRNDVDYKSKNSKTNLAIAKHILMYIETTSESLYRPSSLSFRYDLMVELTYEFMLQLEVSFDSKKVESTQNEDCIRLFESFIKSSHTPFQAKLIILGAYFNTDRNGGNRVEIRKNIIERLRPPHYIKKLFNEMQNSMFQKYLKSSSNAYQKEADVHYVLYQSWDGLPENHSKNIASLRKIASVGLSSNVDGLMTFWGRYPFQQDWETFDDFENSQSAQFSFSPAHIGLFLSLDELIGLTLKNKGMRQLIRQNPMLRAKIEFWRKHRRSYSSREREAIRYYKDSTTVAHRVMHAS